MISNTLFTSAIQSLVPDQVRARVDSYDLLISIVIMPVGFVLAGPLADSIGFTATLTVGALLASVPCVLVTLLPGIRGVRLAPDGRITGPTAALAGPAAAGGQ
jgi:hypothetical protein